MANADETSKRCTGTSPAKRCKLLFQVQQAGVIRDDISVADLMALITGLILARHRNDGGRVERQRVLGVVWDGLRAGCTGAVT
ncbi:SbtR family transcriptional regulator [Streptomyces sp. NPDC004752]